MRSWFSRISARAAYIMGTPQMFIANVVLVLIWLALGPHYHFNTDWNFWVNSSSTITTWLLAILILNDSNRNATALHVKLDALITSLHEVPNHIAGIEALTEDELAALKAKLSAKQTLEDWQQ